MKKLIPLIMILCILITPISVFASNNATIEIKVLGEVKRGVDIEILVDVKEVKNLYAASVDFTYDSSQLNVYKIESTSYIMDNKDNVMELGGEVDKEGNTAKYSFTFLGDLDGLNNQGTLVKIKAKVINDEKLAITKDNMKIKLIQKVGDSVENYEYSFTGYDGDINNTHSSDISDTDKIQSPSNNSSNKNNSNGFNNNSFDDDKSLVNDTTLINDNPLVSDGGNIRLGNKESSITNQKDKGNDLRQEKETEDNKANGNKNNKIATAFLGGESRSMVYIVGILLICIGCIVCIVYYYKVKKFEKNKN